MKKEVVSSPIRWAGSKKKVLNDMLEYFDDTKEIYIEPFLGSGVVLINVLNNNDILKYKEFYVNDINSNIICFFKNLKQHPKKIINEITQLFNEYNKMEATEQEEYYYLKRNEFNNENTDKFEKCILFYFLMKTGFNGVYRENRDGKFNVPFGRKNKVIVDDKSLTTISKLLSEVKFYNYDYKKFMNTISKKINISNSFIYCDPPYIPEDNAICKKQTLYTNFGFDHTKFLSYLMNLKASVMISMSDSEIANNIYGLYYNKRDIRDLLRTINPQRLLTSKEVFYFNDEMKKRIDYKTEK